MVCPAFSSRPQTANSFLVASLAAAVSKMPT
jgi:hypothetical protein